MRHCYELNIPFPVLRNDIQFPDDDNFNNWSYLVVPTEQYLTSEAISWFEQLGVPAISVQLFKGTPNDSTRIHVDGRFSDTGELYIKHHWAINLVVGANSSTMYWYRPLVDVQRGYIGSTGVRHPSYTPNEVELVDQIEVGTKPLLCHIAVPHSVTNHLDQSRWCISIRARNPDSDMPWARACAVFEQYFATQ